MRSVSYAKSIRYGMKLAFRHLADSGYISIDCNAIFSLKVATRNRLLPAMPPEDIAKLLESIDRNTVRGKRDYAFIIVGAAFGLRCCDIATLRLCDILRKLIVPRRMQVSDDTVVRRLFGLE